MTFLIAIGCIIPHRVVAGTISLVVVMICTYIMEFNMHLELIYHFQLYISTHTSEVIPTKLAEVFKAHDISF